MWKKIVNAIVIVVLFGVCIYAGFLSRQLKSTEAELRSAVQSVEQYRTELEVARRTNERYAETFERAKATNSEIGECLSGHVSTLAELRELLQAVRTRYEQMQEIIADMAGVSDIGFYTGDSVGGDVCTLK